MDNLAFNVHKAVRLVSECRVSDAFNAVAPHLENSEDARSLFLQLLRSRMNVFLLRDCMQYIEKRAGEGCPYMQYAWARYHDSAAPDQTSLRTAEEYYGRAVDAGIADARTFLAYMWRDGDFGVRDRERYHSELDRASAEGSQMAVQQKLRDMIYGSFGCKAEPLKAQQRLGKFLKDSEGASYIDPRFFTVMGDACKELGHGKDAALWYRKALDSGDLAACLPLAVAEAGLDENGCFKDLEKFSEIMFQGQDLNCATAFLCVQMSLDKNSWALYDNELRDDITRSLKSDLPAAYELGDALGAYYMGINYLYGDFGFERDFSAAWTWFSRGAARRDPYCFGQLAAMIDDGLCPDSDRYDDEFKHECRLHALRYGDEEMLEDVVNAYRHGCLTEYAAEIEKYYLPAVEEREKHGAAADAEDELPDDDGRFDAWA